MFVYVLQMRQKLLTEVQKDTREPLTKLHKSLVGNCIEEFMAAVEPAFACIDIVVKKPDKKKDRLVSKYNWHQLYLFCTSHIFTHIRT